MEDSTQRAKELYTRFLGSSFNMHREGVLEEYKKFEILRETEIEWLNDVVVELEAVVHSGLEGDFFFGDSIRNYQNKIWL
jgi:hypothetical protein